VAEAAGVSRALVRRGEAELEGADLGLEPDRIRRPGGGRKRADVVDASLLTDLDRLISPDTRGDPESPLRWTCKSTRELADALNEMGHQVSHALVGRLLHEQGYSLQANAKVNEGRQHPDRDAQFSYLNEQVREHLAEGAPVLSVDTKKKELVGEFKNNGREWQPEGQPVAVNVHDFPDDAVGKAIPYGIYDVAQNSGWVSVGQDHDTARFAVEALRGWWRGEGSSRYGHARRLLISADCGGSNGNRSRLWKTELAKFAAETGLEITVCHLPPGTSKWNKVEHRLFSHISMNWRGRPLTSHEVVVDLIRDHHAYRVLTAALSGDETAELVEDDSAGFGGDGGDGGDGEHEESAVVATTLRRWSGSWATGGAAVERQPRRRGTSGRPRRDGG